MNRKRTKSPLRRVWQTAVGVFVLSAILLTAKVSAAKDTGRYHAMGVTLPQPRVMPVLAPVGRFAIRPTPVTADVWFSLDKKGRVTSLKLDYQPGDSLVFEPYRDSLKRIEFLPLLREGKKRKTRLPARLIVSRPTGGGRQGKSAQESGAHLVFPVDSSGKMTAPDLVNLALAELDRRVARLLRFPPYFYARPAIAEDTALMYPFALVRVELDSAGIPVNRELVYATDRRLGEMILIASGWADYSGATVEGKGAPSEGYILVSFYREQNYPTVAWSPPEDSLADRLEFTRVRWYATPGITEFELSATPRIAGERVIHLSRDYYGLAPVRGRMFISDSGRPDIKTLRGAVSNRLRTELNRRLLAMRYYPSMALKLITESDSVSAASLEPVSKWDTLLFELIPADTFDYHLRLLER